MQVLFNIARQVQVEEDNEQFRAIMLADIDQFMHEMKEYDFNPRSNSFLDSDTKLHDKYLKGNRDIGYSKLVQLNAEIGSKSTVLRRLYSSRQEHIKAAIITQDIMKAQKNNTSPLQPIEGTYFRTHNPFNFVDRLRLRLNYHWYIQNRRGMCMKILAILFGALSFVTVLTEVLFFFGEFEETGLRHYLVDEDRDRSYFAQNVSALFILHHLNFSSIDYLPDPSKLRLLVHLLRPLQFRRHRSARPPLEPEHGPLMPHAEQRQHLAPRSARGLQLPADSLHREVRLP